tara:strand:+ start:159 stop:1412 length:1254 start_codon:yes stop_codon:yes gene_type:complete
MMREKIAINDDNFFITKGGATSNYIKFSIPTLNGDRTITLPNSNVDLGNIQATSIAANNVDTGDAGTDCSFVSAGIGNVTVGSGGSGNTTLGSSSSGTTTIRDPTGSIIMTSGAITTSALTTVDLDCSDAMSLNSSSAAINIGNDDVNQNINIGTNNSGGGTPSAARTINLGHNASSTDVNIKSGSGGITLNSTGGTIDFQRSSTSQVALTDSTMTLKENEPYTITHAANDAGDDLTISQTEIHDASLLLTSAGNGTDAIGLSCNNGGITIQSASGTGASKNLFGTNVEGVRFFKVDSASSSSSTAINYTFTPANNAVYYVEARVAIRDTTSISSSGCISVKGGFTYDGSNTVGELGDSTETFGSLPTGVTVTLVRNATGPDTFSVRLTPVASTSYNFDGTIMITTEDNGLKLTSNT